ncbi:hypothetical protein V5O48_018966 [Marasmius crinis-equi]|uniref:HMG box domain-containing protein n=1 Tax=Marasmius crinis-equi TaxID=585013 RepID=A0ABR3EJQ8_9AGAR
MPAHKVKRPPNAWILFRSDIACSITQQDELQAESPRRTQSQISQEISHLWNTLDPTRKAEYERLAAAKKHEHTPLYPDYRFQPIRKEEKERRKRLKKQKYRGKQYGQRNDPVSLARSSQSTNSSEIGGLPPPLCTAGSPDTKAHHANNNQALLVKPLALDPSAATPAQSQTSRTVAYTAPITSWTPSEMGLVGNIPNHTPHSWQEQQTIPGNLNTNVPRLDLELSPQFSWPFSGKVEFEQNLQAITNISGIPFVFRTENIDTDLFNAGDTGAEVKMWSYSNFAHVWGDHLLGNNSATPNALEHTFNRTHSQSLPSLSSVGKYGENVDQFVDWNGGGVAPQHEPREQETVKSM